MTSDPDRHQKKPGTQGNRFSTWRQKEERGPFLPISWQHKPMTDIYSKINNVCLLIIASFVVAWTLQYTRSAMIPFVFAIFLYSTLTPMVNWIQKNGKLPRAVSTSLALMTLIGVMALVVVVVVSSIDNFIQGASQYRASLQETFDIVERELRFFNIELDLDQLTGFAKSTPFLKFAQSLTGQLLSILGNFLMVFIFTLFMLAGEKVRSRPQGPLVQETLLKISTYISTKFFLSLLTGLLVWMVLGIFKVEMAFLFAILTVLLNFIPTVGSLVAIVLPIPILVLQYQLGYQLWTVIILSMAIQFFIGNIVETKMLGDSMDLHPITVLLCLIFWGLIWGVAGMFLAVPITAIPKIILSRMESTQPFSELLAGRFGADPQNHSS